MTFLKRNTPVLKLGPVLKKQWTHLSLCILGRAVRQSRQSSTVLTKPSEQTFSNPALVLPLCTSEYVTPARGASDQRSVCPRERNVSSRNRFIPLVQVLGDKQHRDGSCSRQHHIQTTQWWAQNKYQDCKIDLPSKEMQLWHERQTRVGKHQTRQTVILKDGLFAANGGVGMPHFGTAEVQPMVINCRRQMHEMDKVCSWEQTPNTTLPVSGRQRKKSIFIRLHKGWATSPSLRLRLKTESHFDLCTRLLSGLNELFPVGHRESSLTGITHRAHWTYAYLEIIALSKKIIPLGFCSPTHTGQYCFHMPQMICFKNFFFSNSFMMQPPSSHTTGQTTKGYNTNKTKLQKQCS